VVVEGNDDNETEEKSIAVRKELSREKDKG